MLARNLISISISFIDACTTVSFTSPLASLFSIEYHGMIPRVVARVAMMYKLRPGKSIPQGERKGEL
jgi:hypothetical protein